MVSMYFNCGVVSCSPHLTQYDVQNVESQYRTIIYIPLRLYEHLSSKFYEFT